MWDTTISGVRGRHCKHLLCVGPAGWPSICAAGTIPRFARGACLCIVDATRHRMPMLGGLTCNGRRMPVDSRSTHSRFLDTIEGHVEAGKGALIMAVTHSSNVLGSTSAHVSRSVVGCS